MPVCNRSGDLGMNFEIWGSMNSNSIGIKNMWDNSQEMYLNDYSSYLYKFLVQTSINKNMVVDQKM